MSAFNPLTHYGSMTFERRCALALVPLHEALGQNEPEEWTITREDGVSAAGPAARGHSWGTSSMC
eukprot:scaffold38670_cov41-Tisochrysis_lutea.AAC.1